MFRDRITRKRYRLARSLERAAAPERPHMGRGPRYLVHPEIALACAPSLRAMALALRDDAIVFGEDELRGIQSFITDGSSAFFGRDTTAAMRKAVGLQHAVLEPKPDDRGDGQVVTAGANVRYPSPALTGS